MKLIISSLQVSPRGSKGHLNPAIALALAAKSLGHEVAILPIPSLLTSEDESQLEVLGIRYIRPPHLPKDIIKSREELAKLAASKDSHLAYKSFLIDPFQYQVQEVSEILERESPDAVLYDLLVYSTPVAARKLYIPDYGYCAGLKLIAEKSLNQSYEDNYTKLSPYLKETLGANEESFHNLELLSKNINFVFAPEKLKHHFIVRENIKMVGALPLVQNIDDEPKQLTHPEKPYAILSFGSVLDPADFPQITNTIVSLCKKMDLQLLISSNKLNPNTLPKDAVIKSHLPIKRLLPKAAIYFHHGGANSFSEAVTSGTPQIIFPLTTDQPIQANLLEDIGIGVSFPPSSLDVEKIENAMIRLLNNADPIHEQISKYQMIYQEQNGAVNTIKSIEKSVYSRNIYSEKRRLEDIRIPQSINELKNIFMEANQKKLKLYPISKGKNYGLGSRLPLNDDCVLVDLSNLKKKFLILIQNLDQLL